MTGDPVLPRRVELPGGMVEIRAMRSGDVDGLSALYDDLDPEDRHRRFFSAYWPAREFFERLVALADRGGFGLVAVADPDGPAPKIVGEAEYTPLPNGDAELGITVARAWRGGLGTRLVDVLADVAAGRGVPNLEADVLVGNAPMLSVLRARGAANMAVSDWTMVRVVVATAGDTPTWPGGHERTRVLVESPGGRWPDQAPAREAGVDVVVCSGPGRRRTPCPALTGRACPLVAAADAIVVCPDPEDGRWTDLVRSHRRNHPGVPVCVSRPGQPPASFAEVTQALGG